MIKLEIKNEENYAARLVVLNEFEPIPKADKLQIARIKGYSVIVSKEVKAGDKGIFFPVESQISKAFLSANSLFSDKLLNRNQEKTGFFEKRGRVKAIRLRSTPSEGFFVSLEHFTEWLNIPVSEWNSVPVDTLFDTINGEELCRKYVIRVQSEQGQKAARKHKKLPSRLVPQQFHLHYSTPKLADNVHLIEPEDEIVVSNKLHGTSFVVARVLVKRNLSLWEKIKKFFKAKVNLLEYDDLYSSRSIIKNENYNSEVVHWYKTDVWKIAFDNLKPYLWDGASFYGEIVGYSSTGGNIQGKYDYSCQPGEQKAFIYRITETDASGNVKEWPISKVIEFCKNKGLNHVPVYWKGIAKNLFPELDTQTHWHSNFVKQLRSSFNLEKDCELCKNKVPAEGICIRIENKPNVPALKFKSFNFLCAESKALDKGEVDIETQESVSL